MLFNSFEFLFFFLIVYGIYLILHHRYQNYLLLVASYFFYGFWDWRFLSLILISTIVDYFCGLGIHRSNKAARKKFLLTLSIVTNLGLLFTFKYFNFFTDGLGRLLDIFSLSMDLRIMKMVLPVGISFYTFQTMSYTIDIFRGKLRPTKDFMSFGLFVAFFPQLVAGPIERAKNLLPQVENKRTITYDMVREGLWLILLGYFKKLVIADNMIPFTQHVFENPNTASGAEILLGIYAFAFQIYCDFSGYTDIARGLAKLMGFNLMLNFRFPYLATNPRDFWSRWHISLSTWLRDYLYIPLGGNRGGKWLTYRNLILTMVLGGLWHGAAWNFVAWGIFHGGILIVHRLLAAPLRAIEPRSRYARLLWQSFLIFSFFQVTCFGWLLFTVKSLGDVPILLYNLFSSFAINERMALSTVVVFLFPALLVAVEIWAEQMDKTVVVVDWPKWARVTSYAITFLLILLFGATGKNEFIYFQF